MASLFEQFLKNLIDHGLEYFGKFYGFYRGTCMDNEDPEEQGRILVRVPAVTGRDTHSSWAWPISKWAGRNSGDFYVPDVDDPVVVIFENGHRDHPMWVGGWWPKIDGSDNLVGDMSPYTNKKPTKRIFKTKAGHELSFEDDPENLSCKLVWHDPENDKYSFFSFTKDGSVQTANHKGCFLELRATDDDELVLVMDKNGNMFTLDKDGVKLVDKSGVAFTFKDGVAQLLAPDAAIVNAGSINFKTGAVQIGDVATDSAVKGTSWLAWWTSTVLTWLNTHTHPTGVGESLVASKPMEPPVKEQLLTDILKMQ